jgi:Kef-type K+ transport system membrane component KefB
VWAKAFGEIFERLRLPAVLGEILAGVVLGPYATKLIEPSDTIISMAEIGAIFLLFSVGLETSPSDLIKVGRTSLNVALAGIAAPFLLGFVYLKIRGESAHEAAFVAAAMVATSVGITARVLSDLHVIKSHTSQVILGAAVFDDILGMILLTVVVSLASGTGIQYLHLGIAAAEAIGFALIMIFVAKRVVGRMEPGLQRMSSSTAPLILSLAICLGFSVLANKIGMAAIIGAFFAGLIFADYAPRWELEPPVKGITEFLTPFFFFTRGARRDLHIFTPDLILAAAIVGCLALISKGLGCGLPLLGEGWLTALKVGLGMTPRGEVALIVALIGLQMNMISQRAYAIVILMTAITTVLPPPFLRILFRDEIVQAEEQESESVPADV